MQKNDPVRFAAVSAVLLTLLIGRPAPGAQNTPAWHDAAGVEAVLKQAAASSPALVRIIQIGASLQSKPIWCAVVADGDDTKLPAMLVVAGAHGAHRVGVETALAHVVDFAGRSATDPAAARLFKERAFYIIPALNPDGLDMNAKSPFAEIAGNARAIDHDRDRRLHEDPPDDANGDGFVTMMRIPDPKGDYVIDAKDPRIVRKADRTKGERGTHRLVAEGLDDDGDGQWNEDGPSGVRIDRNFPHLYKEVDRDTGAGAVSEPESRALADFVDSHPNICASVVYGLHDNLRKAPKSDGGDDAPPESPTGGGGGFRGRGGAGGGGGGGGRQAPTSILRDDITIYERGAKLYKDHVGAEGDVDDAPSDGAIHQWLYFQRGIPSFAARIYTPTAESRPAAARDVERGDSRPADAPRPPRAGRFERPGGRPAEPEAEDKSKTERARLEWNDRVLGGSGFVAWAPATAPALKELGAEIGGWKPGVLLNPPSAELAAITKKHTEFLFALATESAPRVALADAKFTENENGLATLKISLRNEGRLPAMTAMARRTGTVRPARIKLTIEGGEIAAGRPQYLVNNLAPEDPPREYTWVLRGRRGAKVRVEVNYPFGVDSVFTGELK